MTALLVEYQDAWGDVWQVPEGYEPADPGQCRSCGKRVLWTVTRAGKRAPLNPDGTSHFSDCPDATSWRRR